MRVGVLRAFRAFRATPVGRAVHDALREMPAGSGLLILNCRGGDAVGWVYFAERRCSVTLGPDIDLASGGAMSRHTHRQARDKHGYIHYTIDVSACYTMKRAQNMADLRSRARRA